MIKRILKNKLVALGYAAAFVENKIKEFNISVDATEYTESELADKIKVIVYEKPTAEISRFFLNIDNKLEDKFLFDGKINAFTKFSIIGSQISLLDYPLGEKLCMIGITKNCDIWILLYMPNRDTINRFSKKTYEDIYGDERENIVSDYMEALTAGNRLSNGKAKDIIYVLLTEFVIDTILVDNSNPKLKLYDNATKFADAITNYEFKYINRRINRIEFVEKYVSTRYLGVGVKKGTISNNPYLLLNEVNEYPDFYLNRPTYVWFAPNSRGLEEIAIYTANETYPQNTYREFIQQREDVELRTEAEKLTLKFSNEAGYPISREYIFSVLRKLNRQLLILPIDFIRTHTAENYEYIEPLRYKFSVIKNKKDFEDVLYNSIEDNLNGRYRYRFVEKLSGIYTTIGNKLNYTDTNGKMIRKQSVADFNINFNAAIIKRETLIDVRSIPQLLGYMYKDLDKTGTDMLPVPSVEIVFYFPDVNSIGQDVEMYNGTSVEIAKGDGTVAFYEIGINTMQATRAVRPKDPNEKYVVVKYINSEDEILKENVIRDVIVGSTFVPEMLPIINDREGKEWVCVANQILNLNVSSDNSKNEIEVRYVKKMARVRINYINKQGSELNPPVVKNMQVGEVFDMNKVKKFIDSTNVEWNLYQSKPNKLIVSEDEQSNILTLVYDIVKADVYIYYQTRDGRELKPVQKTVAVANKDFKPETITTIVEENGLVWKYATDSKNTIHVEENELNAIVFLYDEVKQRTVIQFVDEDGEKVKDDIVQFAQVGSVVEIEYEEIFIDIYNKHWQFKSVNKPSLKVSEKEEENICIVTYEKVLANIIISMLDEKGQRIKDDLIEKAQIGSAYKPTTIKEIEDTIGLGWVCTEEDKTLLVGESEIRNRVSYQYKPFITKVFVQYIDAEGFELLPQKEFEAQVGSKFTPEFIPSLQGKDQRSWILSNNNIKEFKVKKHKEENIIKINYDKKLVDISLSFVDLHGKKLKEDILHKEQLGAEFKPGVFEKITSEDGQRWMVTKTDPARMFVRENSEFKLIYDEIKARVIVKCINLSDSKSIVDDIAIITKLGGVYVPNIQSKIVDKQKHRWKYVGEPGMSIITKENEQENIVTLKYEPDLANVTLRYLNKNQQMVHSDVVNAEQIGKEIAIKEYDKIIEENGMGWKLKNMTKQTLTVDEDDEKNVVVSTYEPLLVPVTTRYINEEIQEITASKVEKIQVGKTFNADILPRITDAKDRIWIYSNIKTVELKVKDDENNKVNIKYLPLKKKVTEEFINLQNESLVQDKIEDVQVGEIYTLKKQERVIDSEDKSWIYQKSSVEQIKVSEDEEKNIIKNYYDKELIQVIIRYQTTEGVTLDKDKVLDLQIGSIYTIEPKQCLDDNEKLTWIVSKDNKLKVKISRNPEENIFTVVYEKYMVNVYDKYINEATGEEVIKPTVTKHQVGTNYLVKVKECVIDDEGKHWVQAAKSEIKIFTSNYKVEPITIVKEEARNVTIVKYKPKLAETTIKYQDPMGKPIKMEEVKKIQVGSIFGEDIPAKIIDNLGNKWSYNPNSNSDIKISEDPRENIVILAYEESKGTVTFKYYDSSKNEIQKETQKLVQIGSTYTPQFETIVTDEQGCVWEYSERDREKFEIKEEDNENIVELTYIPLNVDVEVYFVDLWDNEISPMKIMPAQLGSKYKPNMNDTFTNDKSMVFRKKRMDPSEILVKQLPISGENPNKFKIVYEAINSSVVVIYQDLDGNLLKDEERIPLQVGSKYKPQPVEFIKDKKGNEWQLASAKTDEIVVRENETENQVRFIYEVAKAEIIIRYQNIDGMTILPDKTLAQQVGSEYVPTPEEKVLDKEGKKWSLIRVHPVNLQVGSINNIITITYQEEKTRIIWKYCDEKGNVIRAEEKHEAQIGSRYKPVVKDRVIYDTNEIWRLQRTEPFEIIVSENESENIIKLIYSNARVEETKEQKKEIINPFANTLIEEKAVEKSELKTDDDLNTKESLITEETVNVETNEILSDNEKTKDVRLSEKSENIEELTKSKDEENVKTASKVEEQVLKIDSLENKLDKTSKQKVTIQEPKTDDDIEFEDPDLKRLATGMALTNDEKIAIINLNEINKQILSELNKSKEVYLSGQQNYDYSVIEELIQKEKDIVNQSFEKIISADSSGSKMLKIFEHITASEVGDITFGRLLQRKAILITDYFMDKPLDDMDKIVYICERGKNNNELKLVDVKIKNENLKNERIRNPQPYIQLKATLYCKKILLDNYYKARNIANDNYFTDPSVKSTAMSDIVVGVTNVLVKQAVNFLRKEDIDLVLRNELEAVISLCTPQQIETIKLEIDKFDGKAKRIANKTLQDILKGK